MSPADRGTSLTSANRPIALSGAVRVSIPAAIKQPESL